LLQADQAAAVRPSWSRRSQPARSPGVRQVHLPLDSRRLALRGSGAGPI